MRTHLSYPRDGGPNVCACQAVGDHDNDYTPVTPLITFHGARLFDVPVSLVCTFCAIVAGAEPATVIKRWDDATAIVPLDPVVPGHVIVISHQHVMDFTENPDVTAAVTRRAAEFAVRPANLIASAGREASQPIGHLHVHVVPRRAGDELALPWQRGEGV